MDFTLRSSTINENVLYNLFCEKWHQPSGLAFENIQERQKILEQHNKEHPPIINMRRLYRLTYKNNGRYSQWLSRSIAASIRAEVLDVNYIDSIKTKNIKYIHVREAITLLTYGPNAVYNKRLVNSLSEYTGIPIPPKKRPRAETTFAIKLANYFENEFFHEFELKQQVKIEGYRIDFLLTISNGLEVIDRFIIEFDEAYHQTTRQQRKDKQRDKELSKLGYDIIRVNESEAEQWFNNSDILQYPFHRDSFISYCIGMATKVHSKTKKRYISAESALIGVSYAVQAMLITDSKQTLSQMAKLLDMQAIPYSKIKMMENGKEIRVLLL